MSGANKRKRKKKIISMILVLNALAIIAAIVVGYYVMDRSINESRTEKAEVQEQLKAEKENSESLQSELDKKKDDNNALRAHIEDVEGEVEFLQGQKSDLEKENGDLKQSNESLQEELQNLREQVNSSPKWSPDNVTSHSGVSESGLSKALEGTGLEGLAGSFIDAENEYNINAIFLASLIAQESGWGTSRRAVTDNNLSGYAVYSDSSKGRVFNSKHDSVMETASLLSENYVGEGLKDIHSINGKYSADDLWAQRIISIANDMVGESLLKL
jgi:beta-N-acetylglucosaminidase